MDEHEHNREASGVPSNSPLEPTRFVLPFYSRVEPSSHELSASQLMLLEHIKGKLQKIPDPLREPTFTLAEIIGFAGANEIEESGSIRFHTVGDTGRKADSPQGRVADAMGGDFDVSHPATSPAFFFHLGDVIYGPNKDQKYRPQFYEPYIHYPGKIVGIPGNHDGEVFPATDTQSLRAFLANFCAPKQMVPSIAGTIYRDAMNQPSVFFLLDAPFLQIIGLYSNAAENPGFISGAIPGDQQKSWLAKTLQNIAKVRQDGTGKRKALIIATHHPPYSSGGHSPSTVMLQEIDSICQEANILPDMFLSAHSHNYQRYTRKQSLKGHPVEIPYIVIGTGGYGSQDVQPATDNPTDNPIFVRSRKGYGYLLIQASSASIEVKMFAVEENTGHKSQFDRFVVQLDTNTVHTVSK